MHAQSSTQQATPRTIQADVKAYNEAVDELLYWQMRVKHLQYMLIESGAHLLVDSNHPRYIRAQEGRAS